MCAFYVPHCFLPSTWWAGGPVLRDVSVDYPRRRPVRGSNGCKNRAGSRVGQRPRYDTKRWGGLY